MKICIILNGEIQDYKIMKNIISKQHYDYIICADGGANHAYKMNINPNYILGDLDSINKNIISYYKDKNVIFKKFPSKKNETDTELCIYLAQQINASQVDFIGSLGGRIDHMLANIKLLDYLKEVHIYGRIISEKEYIYIAVDEEMIIDGEVGDTVSVIPIKGDAKGITLTNLEYPLTNFYMKYSSPIGISNVMLENQCKVSVDKGTVLIIRNKKN